MQDSGHGYTRFGSWLYKIWVMVKPVPSVCYVYQVNMGNAIVSCVLNSRRSKLINQINNIEKKSFRVFH